MRKFFQTTSGASNKIESLSIREEKPYLESCEFVRCYVGYDSYGLDYIYECIAILYRGPITVDKNTYCFIMNMIQTK